MRRFTSTRYVPYLRTRCNVKSRWNTNVRTSVRSFTLFLRLLLCMLCFAFAMSGMIKNFHTAVENISEYKAAQLVGEYIDEGVLAVTDDYFESDFVHIGRNGDGQVTSVETNSIEINRFAASLSESILNAIKEKEHEKIKAPLGTITGTGLLSSVGLSVPYRIIPMGKVTVSPVSSFEDAGINQTIHRLQMEVSVKVRILFPMTKKEEEVKRTVLVSETVIIGDIPDFLAGQ